MARYAILPHESANRVYAGATLDLLAAELKTVTAMTLGPVDVVAETLGGVEYLTFRADALDDADRILLSNLSTARALYEFGDGPSDTTHLVPIEFSPTRYYDEDLITIQRYPGKTNEQFTHLLVNLTLAASDAARRRTAAEQPVRLLDPVAGRGTTLNRALMYGFDAAGVEAAAADEDQYRNFITTYLKDHRIKHRNERESVKHGPLAGTSRFKIEIARRQRLEFVHGDTARLGELLPNQRFDLIVADLPYGVQHRAASTKESRRSPIDLVNEAIGQWCDAMPAGAAVGLGWNLRTLPRAELEAILRAAGLNVLEAEASFEHVVDRSITRDVLIATKSGNPVGTR